MRAISNNKQKQFITNLLSLILVLISKITSTKFIYQRVPKKVLEPQPNYQTQFQKINQINLMQIPTDEAFKAIVENQLYKKVITEGEGQLPSKGQEVSALYKGTLTNGDVFDSNQDRDSPFKFTLGQGQVIKGWDQGFAAMKKGEKAVLQIGPQFGYGKAGSGKIPANATLIFEVELLDFQDKKKEKWELSDEQKLTEAKKFKELANDAFKNGNFSKAITLYEDAVSYSEDLAEEEAAALTLAVWSNLSLAYNKTKRYAKSIENANKVLEKDANNLKALYRKGTAQFLSESFADAEATFNQLLKIDANNNQAKAELSKIKAAIQKSKAKEKTVYSKIFANNFYEDKKEEKKPTKPVEDSDQDEDEKQAEKPETTNTNQNPNEPPAADKEPTTTEQPPASSV